MHASGTVRVGGRQRSDGNPPDLTTRDARCEKLLARYGERLACVRQLYDEARGRRLKTVELVIDEAPWRGRPRRPRRNDRDLVRVRVAWEETELRIAVKKAGRIRRPRQKLWEISWEAVRTLGIGHRVVTG